MTQAIEQHITGRSTASRVPGEAILKFFKTTFRHARATCSSKGKERTTSPGEESEGVEDLAKPSGEGYPSEEPEYTSAVANWAVYLGQGAFLGGVRGVLSYYGVRGLATDLVFMGFTSSVDWSQALSETGGNNGAL